MSEQVTPARAMVRQLMECSIRRMSISEQASFNRWKRRLENPTHRHVKNKKAK